MLVCNEVANTKYDLPEGKVGKDSEQENPAKESSLRGDHIEVCGLVSKLTQV